MGGTDPAVAATGEAIDGVTGRRLRCSPSFATRPWRDGGAIRTTSEKLSGKFAEGEYETPSA
jgi:hypothetical protein